MMFSAFYNQSESFELSEKCIFYEDGDCGWGRLIKPAERFSAGLTTVSQITELYGGERWQCPLSLAQNL